MIAKIFIGSSGRFFILLALLLSAFGFARGGFAKAVEPGVVSAAGPQRPSGGYCGIYCLYSAMKLFGMDVEPKELPRPEYVGSRAGSSLAEPKKATEEHGLHAAAAARLTTKELRNSPYPVLIPVKSAFAGKEYGHYELFVRAQRQRRGAMHLSRPGRRSV